MTATQKQIFTDVIQLNPDLSQKDIQEITGKPERTVAYWFSGDRGPDNMSLLLIQRAIEKTCRTLPLDLKRHIFRLYYLPRRWAENNHSGNKEVTIHGERHPRGRPSPLGPFIYNGKTMTLKEIARLSSLSYAGCYARIKKSGAAPRSDVTDIIDGKKNLYLYRKELKTLKEISKASGVNFNTIKSRLRGTDITPGDDITGCVDSGIKRSARP